MISGGKHLLIYERRPANLAIGHCAFSLAVSHIGQGGRVAIALEHKSDREIVTYQIADLAAALNVKIEGHLALFNLPEPRAQQRLRHASLDQFPQESAGPVYDEVSDWMATIDDAGGTGALVLRDLSISTPPVDPSSDRWVNETAKQLARSTGCPVVTVVRAFPHQIINRDAADIIWFVRPSGGSESACIIEQERPATDAEPLRLRMRPLPRVVLFEGAKP